MEKETKLYGRKIVSSKLRNVVQYNNFLNRILNEKIFFLSLLKETVSQDYIVKLTG